jgi:hypothetical protein
MPAIKRPLGLALLALAVGLAGAAPAPAAQRRSLVGVNTDRLEYYSPACPTIDAIKTSQKFGSPRNPGDGTAAVDEDGWPTGDFGVVVAADVPGIAGVYKLSCDGRANVSGTWGRTTVRNVKSTARARPPTSTTAAAAPSRSRSPPPRAASATSSSSGRATRPTRASSRASTSKARSRSAPSAS